MSSSALMIFASSSVFPVSVRYRNHLNGAGVCTTDLIVLNLVQFGFTMNQTSVSQHEYLGGHGEKKNNSNIILVIAPFQAKCTLWNSLKTPRDGPKPFWSENFSLSSKPAKPKQKMQIHAQTHCTTLIRAMTVHYSSLHNFFILFQVWSQIFFTLTSTM